MTALVKKQGRPGFASLSPEQRIEMGRRGGKASQASGNGHHWGTFEEQSEAGKKKWEKTSFLRQNRTTKEKATMTTTQTKGKGKRGFASMSPEKVREIARMGGKSAHAQGVAHKWTRETAQAAGRKGGARSKRRTSKPKEE